MMDNEALVDQIVRNLSFEVVAIPESIVTADNTSKSTPLNVKVKVRKKSDAVLRHGVLSMPKVETKPEYQKDAASERIRLVSSEQTIMNFKMLLEADLEKNIAHEKHKSKLNAITPVLETKHKEGKIAEVHTSPVLTKRNKDIFGRSKPGGCLDPPYGEDKYSYQPTTQDAQPPKDESTKPRRSSILKNNIFKKKRKSSLTSDQFINTDVTNMKKSDTTKYSNETVSLPISKQYSNSIITYPHISDAFDIYRKKEISREEEPSHKKIHSNDEKLKNCSIDGSSYFIMQKKSKSFSYQSDSSIMHKNNTKCTETKHSVLQDEAKLEDKNILDETIKPKKVDDNTSGSVFASSASSNSTALMVKLKSTIRKENVPKNEEKLIEHNSLDRNSALKYNDTKHLHHENKIIMQVDELETYDIQTTGDKNIEKILPEIENNCITAVDEVDNTINENRSQIFKSIKSAQNIIDNTKTSFNSDVTVTVVDVTILQNALKNKPVISESNLTTASNNSNIITEAINHTKRFENRSKTLINSNSLTLVTRTRERSMLNVTTDLAKDMLSQKEITSLILLEYDKFTYLHSTEEISQIWENETEPLKSMADVIFSETVPVINDNVSNLSTETFSERVQSIFETYDKTNSETSFVTQPNFHGKDNLTEGAFDNKEKMNGKNVDIKSSSINCTFEKNSIKKNYTQDKSPDTGISNNERDRVPQENKLQVVEKSPIDTEIANNFGKLSGKNIYTNVDTDEAVLNYNHKDYNKNLKKVNSKSSIRISNQSTTLISISDIYNNEESGIMHDNKASNTSMFEKEPVTIDDLIDVKKMRSVSELSGFDSQCLLHKTSDKESDNAYCKSCLNIDIEPIAELRDIKRDDILDIATTVQTSRLFNGKKTLQLKNDDNASRIAFQSDQFSSEDHRKQPSICKSVIPWKIDIALHSYINENDERVIKSFDSEHTPQRQLKDAFLVACCYMDSGTNEIKIPVNENNDLSIKIIQTKYENRSSPENLYGFVNTTVETHGDKKIKIKVPEIEVEDYKSINYKDLSKLEASKDNKDVINANLRNALNMLYEKELVPLQDIIKGLREEIDALVVYQLKDKEKILKPVSKRSRPIRLVHPNKRCACLRRF